MAVLIPKYQSIPKDFVSLNLNEDRVRFADNFISISDGAGGTGIYCGEWASILLENLPDEPIKSYEEFIEWFKELPDQFLFKHEPSDNIDGHIRRRFYEEGSSATLTVVWEFENEYYWLCIGDSNIFFIEANSYNSYPFKNSNDFKSVTNLLNWKVLPNSDVISFGKKDIGNKEIIIATDAISHHIFSQIESGISIDTILNSLKEIINNRDEFVDYIKTQKDISEDDYSILTWKKNPFK
jgi:serine/threonine protein phosphatase PrpC